VRLTSRQTVVTFLGLAFAMSLAFLMLSSRPAVADLVALSPLPPVENPDERAGACYSFYPDPPGEPDRPFVQMARDAGSRWDRFDFIWPNIEPSNNSWNFGAYDTLVDDLDVVEVDMVGILLWTPDWATTARLTGPSLNSFDQRPGGWYAPVTRTYTLQAPMAVSASSAPPEGLYLAWDDPNNHWGDYVYTVVSHFGDRVKHWEMWNEPEWTYFWTGTSTDYAQLLKVGYQATKAACPDCTVLFGGLHYWANPSYYRWVLNAIHSDPSAPQNNYFFDVMSIHLYSRSANAYTEVNNIRAGMSVYNVGDHPIWLTETGVPVWGDPEVSPKPEYDYAATQDEAAAYVIQSYANALASDVERYFFFRTHDADMGEYFGLVRNDHSLRPAYVAYQVANTYLISPTFVTRVSTSPHMRATLWGTPHGKVSVLWNEGPATGVYTLPATIETATVVDRWGVTEAVAVTGEVYTFTLPGATANLVSNPDDYIIGGDPLIVIESETPNEPPTSTVHPLPEIVYAPTFTVTWEGHDSQSGVWLYDVQVRDGAGEWKNWRPSTTATSGQYTGRHGHIYYFRSRATDHIGNRGAWPEDAQAHTTPDLSSTLHFSIGALFADDNRNDTWDRVGTLVTEITLTQVALRFVDPSGHDVVSPTVGSTWAFTTTIHAGETYELRAADADYSRVVTFTWPAGGEVYTQTYDALGLWPMKVTYLPLILRNGG